MTARARLVIRKRADIAAAWQALGGVPLLYEEFIDFEFEVSIIGVRARDGREAHYPLTRNWHVGGILRLSVAPWKSPRSAAPGAAGTCAPCCANFSYVGMLAIEFFVRDGRLIANEIAPRVHNSGHWTIEGAVTSQFENHLRAIAGLPLGSTAAVGHAAMINLIGRMPSADSRALAARRALARLWQAAASRPQTRALHARVSQR